MAPKRGQKRKAPGASGGAASASNGTTDLSPPDRTTWPGWVEMESEPAYFNVMLREMGVRGAKIQEVYSMDQEMLAFLPRPIHALIFLFRYRTADQLEQDPTNGDTDHIWFANQIPDFACATVALLNIVNNIPGLQMGKELLNFKQFTNGMDAVAKGDSIDNFDFVKRIHNSFARETDLLNADMHTKGKFDKAQKRDAAAKRRAAAEAKKVAQSPLKDATTNARGSTRKRTTKDEAAFYAASTPASRSTRSRRSSTRSTPALEDGADGEYDPTAKKTKAKTNGMEEAEEGIRRSTRTPKPRKDIWAVQGKEDEPEEGFHFIAYMPIGDHVWKLDGLDRKPTDCGSFGAAGNGADGGTGNWIDAATPAIMQRMDQFQGAEIEFNLMAVVHDPAASEKEDLVRNVKAIQAVESKLTALVEDWKEMEGAETRKDTVMGVSPEFGITEFDIDAARVAPDVEAKISAEEDLLGLINLRQSILTSQNALRSGLRDAMRGTKDDDEKARHRRHDYGKFIRTWLTSLAEQEVLGDLIDGE